MKSVHLVCSPELGMLLTRALENEGYTVSGKHTTLQAFISGFSSKEVDPSAIVIMEGGAGLSIPVKSADIVGLMTLIRKYLKHTRLIVQLDPALQSDIEFIRSMVNMNIHDLQFTTEFRGNDLLTWIKEKKTTRDYYNVLGKKKGLFSLKSSSVREPEAPHAEAPVQASAPPKPVQSLTRSEPTSASKASPSPERRPPIQQRPAATATATATAVRPKLSGRSQAPAPSEAALRETLEQTLAEHALPAPEASKTVLGGHVPLVIGICGIGGEEDVGAAAFLLAAGLVELGWKPLVCGEDRPEIGSLERIAFDGEKEDSSSNMFEYEGVTFYRRGYTWDISELLASSFTHIIMWVDIHKEKKGNSGLEIWWNSQIPLMVGNGAMWKYELLKEKLNTLNPHERKRCRLLLENGQQDVLRMLKKDYPDIQASLLPVHQDPLYPDKEAIDWVKKLLSIQKKIIRKQTILWGIVGAVLLLTLILVGLGISFVPESR
jgi:hypothetical protein